jgi:hypothetical protein
VLDTVKKICFWNYARNTWQWDILCVLILTFIFLTPKSWFENGKRGSAATHQTFTSTLWIGPEVIENEQDKVHLEETLKTLTGRQQVQVVAVRKVSDHDGRTRGYEVDIR